MPRLSLLRYRNSLLLFMKQVHIRGLKRLESYLASLKQSVSLQDSPYFDNSFCFVSDCDSPTHHFRETALSFLGVLDLEGCPNLPEKGFGLLLGVSLCLLLVAILLLAVLVEKDDLLLAALHQD
jgi:hypothetical protein